MILSVSNNIGAVPSVASQSLQQLPNLPHWAPYFAFYASLFLSCLTIIGILYALLKASKVEFYLTKEIFFRLSSDGEVLFCNGVLVAHRGNVLQKKVDITLKRVDAVEKTFPLEVLNFGTPVKGSGALPDFFFYTASPLAFIQENIPERNIYYCVNREYSERIRKVFDDFRERITINKPLIDSSRDLPEEQRPQEANEFVKGIPTFIEQIANDIMQQFQLEKGDYKLTAQLTYRQKNSPIPRLWDKSVQSSITFSITDDVKKIIKGQLTLFLSTIAWNILSGQNQPVVFPEYKPYNIKES